MAKIWTAIIVDKTAARLAHLGVVFSLCRLEQPLGVTLHGIY